MRTIIVDNGDCRCAPCRVYEARQGRRWNTTTKSYETVQATR